MTPLAVSLATMQASCKVDLVWVFAVGFHILGSLLHLLGPSSTPLPRPCKLRASIQFRRGFKAALGFASCVLRQDVVGVTIPFTAQEVTQTGHHTCCKVREALRHWQQASVGIPTHLGISERAKDICHGLTLCGEGFLEPAILPKHLLKALPVGLTALCGACRLEGALDVCWDIAELHAVFKRTALVYPATIGIGADALAKQQRRRLGVMRNHDVLKQVESFMRTSLADVIEELVVHGDLNQIAHGKTADLFGGIFWVQKLCHELDARRSAGNTKELRHDV